MTGGSSEADVVVVEETALVETPKGPNRWLIVGLVLLVLGIVVGIRRSSKRTDVDDFGSLEPWSNDPVDPIPPEQSA